MKFVNFIVVRLAVLVAMGILAAHYLPVSHSAFPTLIGLCGLLFLTWRLVQQRWQLSPLFGLLTYLAFFVLGYYSYQIKLPEFQPTHYSHFVVVGTPQLFQLKIKEELKADRFSEKYTAEINFAEGQATTGKVLLYRTQDSSSARLRVDEVLLVSADISEVPPILNPNQFDYSKYLAGLGVHHQVQISTENILKSRPGHTTLRGFAEEIRNYCIEKLRQSPLQLNERAILQALVLGQRRDIDRALYAQYAAAGAVHILAVSGLHVGILFFIFQFLTKPLRRLLYGRQVQAMLVIVGLFSFALLAGLSPSVVRAASMFSLFVFAQALQRETNSMNTLFISFLGLLLINPLWIFHVGFQMSYLAVFFILLLQPKIYNLWWPKSWLLRKFWGITSVTLAAQIGVVPVSLYYFHQFPGLFLVTNLVVLPCVGFLLSIGLLIVILAAIDMLPDVLALGYNQLVSLLNTFIAWVARQDDFLFSEISLRLSTVLAIYITIFGIFLLWKRFTALNIYLFLTGTILILGSLLLQKYENGENELVIFHKNRESLMALKEGAALTIFSTDTIRNNWEATSPVKSYSTFHAVDSLSISPIPYVFRYDGTTVLRVDSMSVYPSSEKVDIIWLTGSPRVNLERLIDSLRPQKIIADGNNYRSFVNRWEKTCNRKKLPFHHTGAKGAFLIE